MLKTNNSQPKTSQRGFTLLLAALVASISLALGAAVFSIAQKQLTLSGIGRDSQFAFYAADTVAECALYWDFRCNYFAISADLINPSCSNPNPSCDGAELGQSNMEEGRTENYPYTMTSDKINLSGNLCAEVSVEKSLDSKGAVRTVIHADGYNTDCPSIGTNARALQRSVELHY